MCQATCSTSWLSLHRANLPAGSDDRLVLDPCDPLRHRVRRKSRKAEPTQGGEHDLGRIQQLSTAVMTNQLRASIGLPQLS